MNSPEVTTIGTGALGAALTKALHQSGYPVKSIYNRTASGARTLAAEIDADVCSTFPQQPDELGTMVFITVRDAAIAQVARRLAKLSNDLSEFVFVHCSGNEPSEVLKPLSAKGAHVAAFHPLQTFTATSGPADFENIYFDLEGDEGAVGVLNDMAGRLGAKTIRVPASAKPYLHAAAVTASNYLLALLEASGRIAELGGLKKGEIQEALLPLIKTTLDNAESGRTEDILTGPVKRGDIQTVKEHIELLRSDKSLMSLYKKLGSVALDIAVRSSTLSEEKIEELSRLLKS